MSRVRIPLPVTEITEFCRRHGIRSLSLFGSVLREDFRPDSDVDLLVEFEDSVRPGLREWLRMQEELERILGRKVDLVERKAVEMSENYIRRRRILRSLEPIYVAG